MRIDSEKGQKEKGQLNGGGCAIHFFHSMQLLVRSTQGDSRVANLVRLSLGASFLPPNHLPNPLESC